MKRDPYRYFRVEARELLEQMSKGMLNLEADAAGTDLSTLLRLAHTLKGAARVVKQREIGDLAHAFEDMLAPYRKSGERIPREHVSAVLATLDAIGVHVAALPAAEGESAATAAAMPSEPARSIRADVAEVDALLDGLREVQSELASMRSVAAEAEGARQLATTLVGQLSPLRSGDALRSTGPSPALARARLLADELHGMVAGLERRAVSGVERIERELRQAHEQTERLRLIPAGTLFDRLRRIVRDSAESVGKQIAFHAHGAELRLDGDVLDAVQTALVQIMLNSVAHGIEPADERVRAGKPAEGTISVEVVRRGHQISFRCIDDGRGVDLDGVRKALQRKGALPAGAATMDAAELLRALLRGGITTARAVTGLAGRGVGLDIVRDVADRLGGDVAVQTSRGSGTTVELSVRASLISFEALVVEAGGAHAAVPLDAVWQVRRVLAGDAKRGLAGDTIVHDGRDVPLMSLAALLTGGAPQIGPSPGRLDAKPVSAVLVGDAHPERALVVDHLLGAETIVFRPLPPLAPAEAFISGTYVDAEGRLRVVLDPDALVTSAAGRWTNAEPASVPAAPPILVIDDSLTTRMLEQSILESAGHEVALATSAEEGLTMARRGAYGLILVDVEMPGMDGFAFVAQCRADAKLRDVPCVLVTSRDAPEDRQRGVSVGADGYVIKGAFDQTGFLRLITTLLKARV